jgi:hypothetical protein
LYRAALVPRTRRPQGLCRTHVSAAAIVMHFASGEKRNSI